MKHCSWTLCQAEVTTYPYLCTAHQTERDERDKNIITVLCRTTCVRCLADIIPGVNVIWVGTVNDGKGEDRVVIPVWQGCTNCVTDKSLDVLFDKVPTFRLQLLGQIKR